MPDTRLLAALAVADVDLALPWYERLVGRPADSRPMDGLAEWHFPQVGVSSWSRTPTVPAGPC
jgi:hypothetical protein